MSHDPLRIPATGRFGVARLLAVAREGLPVVWRRLNRRRLKQRNLNRRHLGRPLAAVPAVAALLAVAMTAGSTPRPDTDREAELLARATRGDLGPAGLAAMSARLDPSQLALAIRHDPNGPQAGVYGLTPGWETLSLGGKPSLDLGANGREAQKLNAATPSKAGAWRPAPVFAFRPASAADRARALRCLSQAVYYEAALESDEGQAAVAQVVLNRVRDPNYPSTVCGVVFQGAERTTGCQFSFTCDGAMSQAPVPWAWDRARKVAERALAGHVAVGVGTATHYHADYVHPWWAPTLDKITRIGAHIFYRWKGVYGETAAFTSVPSGREPVIDEARFSRPRIAPPLQTASAEVVAGQPDPTVPAGFRTVEIDGRKRVVGTLNLGGRRAPTPQDVAAINDRLRAFETGAPATTSGPAIRPASRPIPGVATMEVEEVGRPAPRGGADEG